MDVERARVRAEASFKRKADKLREGANAWAEYEQGRRAEAEKTLRLRALRLAKEAAEAARVSETDAVPRSKRRPRRSAQR